MTTETKLFVAVKALIVERGRLLLLREAAKYKDGTHIGEYDVPGGRIEPAEDLMAALRREVSEETGLAVTDATLFDTTEWWPKKNNEQWHIVGLFYRVEVSDAARITLSTDHDDYLWHDLNEAPPSNLIATCSPVLERLRGLRLRPAQAERWFVSAPHAWAVHLW